MNTSRFIAFVRVACFSAGCALSPWVAAQSRPTLIQPVTVDYPDAAQAAGHEGTVNVRIAITAEGTVEEPEIVKSSRSPLLDAAAMASVQQWRFKPATDAEGQAVRVVMVAPVQFEKTNSVDFTKKPCGEFVKEVRWTQEVHPEQKLDGTRLYLRTLGFLTLRAGQADRMLALAKVYPQAYERTIATCEQSPDRPFFEVLVASLR